MEVKNILISGALVVLFFIGGVFAGIYYQGQKAVSPLAPSSSGLPSPLIKSLSSSVVPAVAAYGTILKIDGQNLTLGKNSDSMIVPIRADAKIYTIVLAQPAPVKAGSLPAKPTSVTKQIALKDLKVGDNVSVNFKVLVGGQIEGFTVIVLPVAVPLPVAPIKK